LGCLFLARIVIAPFLYYPLLGISMKKYQPSHRGRFVHAHLRRSPTNPGDYFNVVDYQEKFDRLRARQGQMPELQMRFQFSMPEEPEKMNPNPDDSVGD
jgi:hypothetical protein